MNFTASYANLETLIPGIDTDPASINPGGPPPKDFSDTAWPGGTSMSISGSQWVAGLSKRFVSPAPALLTSISQITLSYQIRPSQLAFTLSQANENDLMVVDPAGNRYNGSMRKNNQTGGVWEIALDDKSWTPTTFKPGRFAPDVWTQVVKVYRYDWAAKMFQYVSITEGNLPTFHFPQKPIPATPGTGWQPSIIDWQSQETLLSAGSFVRDMRNVTISLQ